MNDMVENSQCLECKIYCDTRFSQIESSIDQMKEMINILLKQVNILQPIIDKYVIHVKGLKNEHFKFDITTVNTVLDIKQYISKHTNIPVENMRIIFPKLFDYDLENDILISHYEITEGSTLWYIEKLSPTLCLRSPTHSSEERRTVLMRVRPEDDDDNSSE